VQADQRGSVERNTLDRWCPRPRKGRAHRAQTEDQGCQHPSASFDGLTTGPLSGQWNEAVWEILRALQPPSDPSAGIHSVADLMTEWNGDTYMEHAPDSSPALRTGKPAEAGSATCILHTALGQSGPVSDPMRTRDPSFPYALIVTASGQSREAIPSNCRVGILCAYCSRPPGHSCR
jgi:hypothetical protein